MSSSIPGSSFVTVGGLHRVQTTATAIRYLTTGTQRLSAAFDGLTHNGFKAFGMGETVHGVFLGSIESHPEADGCFRLEGFPTDVRDRTDVSADVRDRTDAIENPGSIESHPEADGCFRLEGFPNDVRDRTDVSADVRDRTDAIEYPGRGARRRDAVGRLDNRRAGMLMTPDCAMVPFLAMGGAPPEGPATPPWAYAGSVPEAVLRGACALNSRGDRPPFCPARILTAADLQECCTHIEHLGVHHGIRSMEQAHYSVCGRWQIIWPEERYDVGPRLSGEECAESTVALACVDTLNMRWPLTTAAWRRYMGISPMRDGTMPPRVARRGPL